MKASVGAVTPVRTRAGKPAVGGYQPRPDAAQAPAEVEPSQRNPVGDDPGDCEDQTVGPGEHEQAEGDPRGRYMNRRSPGMSL